MQLKTLCLKLLFQIKSPASHVRNFNAFKPILGALINGDGINDYRGKMFHGWMGSNVLHAMGDNEISTGYGWEYDSVLAKKFDDHFTAIAKLGYFDTSDALYKSTTRVSVELNYTF